MLLKNMVLGTLLDKLLWKLLYTLNSLLVMLEITFSENYQ